MTRTKHYIIRNFLVLILSVFFATACESDKGIEGMATELPSSGLFQDTAAPGESIAELDIITVNVFGADDLSGDYQVDYEGKLKLPLIGEISAAGKTPITLASQIERRYESSYLQNAEVTVLMKEAKEQLITVDGSVEQPGQYPIQGRTTLMQAVALAGGVDEFANLKRIIVFREIGGESFVAGYNLKDIRVGDSPDPLLQRGDIIVVDGSNVRRDYRDLVRAVPILAIFRPF